MLRCEIDEVDRAGFYLGALNRCFPQWGDERHFTWCFRRRVGGPPANLMVLRDDRGPVAGSAVTYRTLRLAGGRQTLVGIMTGSWTLPEARGQGCFTQLIAESVALTRAHRGAMLLAFVTERNASFRRLRDAGAGLLRSSYVFSSETEPPPRITGSLQLRAEEVTDALVERVAGRRERAAEGTGHVVYTPQEWREQLLEHRHPTELLALGDAGWVVTEAAGAVLRVQATSLVPGLAWRDVVSTILARAQDEQRGLFLFSMDTALTSACRELGLEVADGYLTMLAADSEALGQAAGNDGAWSASDSRALADPGSPWCLGPIRFESGDRM